MIHLNYDGKQNNGIIFNTTYTQGCMFIGAEFKPTLSFDFDSFQYSEVFTDVLDYVQVVGTKTVMTQTQADEIKLLATDWVQPLGQEGNPTPEQITERAEAQEWADYEAAELADKKAKWKQQGKPAFVGN